MELLVSVFIMIAAYVKIFSNDFESESIEKVVPFLSMAGLAILTVAILINW